MAQPDRLVLLDDTNPSIQYSGPWFTAQDVAPADTGGPAFQNTLHGVNVDGNFSFSFSGVSPWLVCLRAFFYIIMIVIFRIAGRCSRDKHNWGPRYNLGVFCRQC